ncbi:MAG: phage holin family protein [Nibricoccus sp.]
MNIGFAQIIPAAKVLIDGLKHRSQLAAVELGSARDHLHRTTVFGAIAFILALLGAFTVNFTLVAAVWDRADRALILGLVGIGYLVLAGVFGYLVGRRLKTWTPWKETVEQLKKDHECVQDLFPPKHSAPTRH